MKIELSQSVDTFKSRLKTFFSHWPLHEIWILSYLDYCLLFFLCLFIKSNTFYNAFQFKALWIALCMKCAIQIKLPCLVMPLELHDCWNSISTLEWERFHLQQVSLSEKSFSEEVNYCALRSHSSWENHQSIFSLLIKKNYRWRESACCYVPHTPIYFYLFIFSGAAGASPAPLNPTGS